MQIGTKWYPVKVFSDTLNVIKNTIESANSYSIAIPNQTWCSPGTLLPGTPYQFTVAATNSPLFNVSAASAVASATTTDADASYTISQVPAITLNVPFASLGRQAADRASLIR